MQPEQSHIAGGPIHIVGYFHTGTTLLRDVLRKSPVLFTAEGEPHFYQDLARYQREYADLDDPQVFRDFIFYLVSLARLGYYRADQQKGQHTLDSLGLSEAEFETIVAHAQQAVAGLDAPVHASLFGIVMDELTALAGKQRWLEKTPDHVHFLPQLLSLRPDARVIVLIRDPRATIASRKHRRSDEWLDALERKQGHIDRETNFDALIDSLMWKEAISAAKSARRAFPGRVLMVRYEDMVTDPEPTVRRIFEFVELPFQTAYLEIGWVNSTTQTDKSVIEGISQAAVDRWKKTLTPEEIHVCQMALRQDIQEFGYAIEPTGLGAKAKAPLLLCGSAFHLFERMRRRQSTGVEYRRATTLKRVYRRVFKTLIVEK
jgi:hypothetical protein